MRTEGSTLICATKRRVTGTAFLPLQSTLPMLRRAMSATPCNRCDSLLCLWVLHVAHSEQIVCPTRSVQHTWSVKSACSPACTASTCRPSTSMVRTCLWWVYNSSGYVHMITGQMCA